MSTLHDYYYSTETTMEHVTVLAASPEHSKNKLGSSKQKFFIKTIQNFNSYLVER